MAFLLAADVIRRAGKDLWWRATPDSSCGKDDICVGSRQKWEDVLPAFIEADLLRSKSVGGGKYELQHNEEKWKDVQQHLKEHCSLKLHLLVDVSAEREDKTQGASCLCSQVA